MSLQIRISFLQITFILLNDVEIAEQFFLLIFCLSDDNEMNDNGMFV
jgi:hypothetical protein